MADIENSGADRFAELAAEYSRMTAISGDHLTVGASALYIGIMRDGWRWCALLGLDPAEQVLRAVLADRQS